MINLADIEIDVKSGNLSNVAIAKKYDVTEGYIRKIKKQYGWKAGDPISQLPDPEPKTIATSKPYDPGQKQNDLLANITIDIAERMCQELHHITPIIGQIEQWIVEATRDDKNDRRRQLMLNAVSFSQRANDLKTLANILVQTRGVISSASEVGKGKKEQAIAAANQATAGRFAPASPPLKAVK